MRCHAWCQLFSLPEGCQYANELGALLAAESGETNEEVRQLLVSGRPPYLCGPYGSTIVEGAIQEDVDRELLSEVGSVRGALNRCLVDLQDRMIANQRTMIENQKRILANQTRIWGLLGNRTNQLPPNKRWHSKLCNETSSELRYDPNLDYHEIWQAFFVEDVPMRSVTREIMSSLELPDALGVGLPALTVALVWDAGERILGFHGRKNKMHEKARKMGSTCHCDRCGFFRGRVRVNLPLGSDVRNALRDKFWRR